MQAEYVEQGTPHPGNTGEHPYNLRQALERFERNYIRNILELTRWNIEATAVMLGISPNILQQKMLQYQLAQEYPYRMEPLR